jgi:hypothetical protein
VLRECDEQVNICSHCYSQEDRGTATAAGTSAEHGCNIIVAIGGFMPYIPAMNAVLFALPFVVALAFAALTIRQEMR